MELRKRKNKNTKSYFLKNIGNIYITKRVNVKNIESFIYKYPDLFSSVQAFQDDMQMLKVNQSIECEIGQVSLKY